MIVNIEIMKLVDDRVHENIKRNGEDYVKKAAGLVLIGALSLGLAACDQVKKEKEQVQTSRLKQKLMVHSTY